MLLTSDLEATHRDLSQCDFNFRRFATETPDLLDATAILNAVNSCNFLTDTFQPWPTFVRRSKLRSLANVARGVANLLRKVPGVAFQGDFKALSGFYGLDSAEHGELLFASPNAIDVSLGRGDFIDTEDGWRCLEFNFTPSVGGWETSLVAAQYLQFPAITRFVGQSGVRPKYTSTIEALFNHVVEHAIRFGHPPGEALNVALACVPEEFAMVAPGSDDLLNDVLSAVLRRRGLTGRVGFCTFDDLTVSGRMIRWGDRPVRIVVDLTDGATPPAVFRAFKAGGFYLFNGPIERVLSDKRNLGLLSASIGTGTLSADEERLLARHLPWTRIVEPVRTRFRNQEVFLPDLLEREQAGLVLKKASATGGSGVLLGRSTDSEKWREACAEALANGHWVVQERVESRPYLFPLGPGCGPHDVVWGPFLCGQSYGGVILRMQPRSCEGPINLSLGATVGIVFEVEG